MTRQELPISHKNESGFWPHLFDPFREFGHAVSNFFAPKAEASHSDDSYEISLELPGVSEDDVSVSIHEDILTIKGEKKAEREEKKKDFYFSERSYGAFQRSFRLPANTAVDDIQARFNDGVLSVIIPKMEPEASQARAIKVERG